MSDQALALSLAGCTLSPTGAVFDKSLTQADWIGVWRACRVVDGCINWVKGDWFNHGRRFLRQSEESEMAVYSDDELSLAIAELIPADSSERKELRTLAWVCRKVPPSRRRDALSFSHHREVAPLPASEQTKLLKQAEAHGWSVADLREQIVGGLRCGEAKPSINFVPLRWANEFLRWVGEEPLADWPEERREAVARQLRPLLERLKPLFDCLNES